LDDEFQGRAKVIKSYITNETTIDMNGQGTAMAALIGGKTYGVAKKANLVGIKALNQQGIGMVADLIKGIELAAADFVLGRSAPRLLVLAFGGAKSQPIDDAVNAAAKKGVVTIAVSGSSSADACNFSPARATGVFTVGASDRFDRVLSNSNRGKCISMFAPGRDITTMWRGAEQRVVSGSSIAAAHAAGVAALYLSMNPSYASAQEVYNRMVYGSTRDVLQGLDSTTPNRLLFNGRGQ
jgi:subtilisin family serine protease